MGLNGGIRGEFYYNLVPSAGQAITVNLVYGGLPLTLISTVTASQTGVIYFTMLNAGATNSQSIVNWATSQLAPLVTAYGVDSTVNQIFTVNVIKSHGPDLAQLTNFFVQSI